MRGPLKLAVQTAVITGAGSGIGRALALKAAAEGMRVAICDVDAAGLGQTAALLDGQCLSQTVDVCDLQAMQDFADSVAAELPSASILFANAGILRQGKIADAAPQDIAALFAVNVGGAINTVRAFTPALRQGAPAQIVITGSAGSLVTYPGLAGYCATKHALWPIVEALREELGSASVGVSLFMPGSVATAIFDVSQPDRPQAPDAITPDEAARIAFAGAAQDRFLIHTHPTLVDRVRARFAATLTELEAFEA